MSYRSRPRRAKVAGSAFAGLICAAVSVAVTATPALAAPSDDGSGAQLRVANSPAAFDTAPGTTLDQQIEISNIGTAAADGVTLTLKTTPGLDLAHTFSNCVYAPIEGQTEFFQSQKAVCRIDASLAAGATYRLSTPFSVTVSQIALNENLFYAVVDGVQGTTSGTPGQGAALTLVQSDSDGGSDYPNSSRQITAPNTADLRATGDSVHGKPGEQVTVTAKFTDAGPAWVGFSGDDQIALMVDIPKGTEAVKVPDECKPFDIDGPTLPALGKPEYICLLYPNLVLPGKTFAFPFDLKIAADATDTQAKTWVTSTYGDKKDYAFDPDHSNDSAVISVKVTGPAGADTSGTSGTSGTTAGSAANAPAAQAAESDPSAELAATGAGGTTLVGAAAFTALLAGAGLTLTAAARRRRSRA